MSTTAIDPEIAFREWLENRRSYIGGSEAFELLNQAQYGRGCATALGYRKLGVVPDYELDEDEAIMTRGEILEPIAAAIYEKETGRKVRRPPMDASGHAQIRRHPQHEWAAVATDRLILTGHAGVTTVGDLEIKTRDQGQYLRVLRQGPFYGDLLQPQWSMFVTGHEWASLAMLGVFGGLPLLHIDMVRDEELMDVFQRQGDAFADRVWGMGEVPTPVIPATDQRCKVCVYRQTCRGEQLDQDELRELREMNKASRQLVQIANPDLSRTLHDIELMKRERDSLQASLDVANEHAMMMLNDIDAAIVRGFGKVYKLEARASYFDSTALKQAEPDTYERYIVRRAMGTHYLRTYPTKESKNGAQ